MADIALITGFSRHKLKGLFRELPGYDAPAEQARVARHYSKHDLIVLAVCCELDEQYGLKRTVIGQLINDLQKSLSGPRVANQAAYLLINVPALTARYLEKVDSLSEGLMLPLHDIFRRVDVHLEYGKSDPLDLGPVSVSSGKTSKVSKYASSVSNIGQRKKVGGAKR